MSIYYKYAPDVKKTVALSYVDDCVYWYISEALGKWFVDTLGKIFHMNFLGYSHCFISIRIYQMKVHSIYVDQARYDTSVIAKYLYTSTVENNAKYDTIIFVKYGDKPLVVVTSRIVRAVCRPPYFLVF